VLGEFRLVVPIFEVSEVFLESYLEGLSVCLVYFILQSGQTRKPFKIRLQEHFRDFKYWNNMSKFAQQLLENIHSAQWII